MNEKEGALTLDVMAGRFSNFYLFAFYAHR